MTAGTAHALALGLLVADVLVRAVRLRLLLREDRASLPATVAVNALGDAASAVTPARLGGEPARFLALGRVGIPVPPRIVALATERIVDLSVGAVAGAIAVVLLGGRGFADVEAFGARLVSARTLPWLVVVAAVTMAATVAVVRWRRRLPAGVRRSLRELTTRVRAMPRSLVGAAAALTLASMAARVTILPVLLAGTGVAVAPLPAVVGSFALIYGQLLLPMPAGVGAVELGFVAGVAPLLDPTATAALLAAWRLYTLVLPAGLGFAVWLMLRRGQATRPSGR